MGSHANPPRNQVISPQPRPRQRHPPEKQAPHTSPLRPTQPTTLPTMTLSDITLWQGLLYALVILAIIWFALAIFGRR